MITMKKLLLILAIMCVGLSVEAKTVREATAEALNHFKIEESANTSAIRRCKNYASIDEADVYVAATALDAGILIPKNNVLNMDSEDLTPLVNGITSYGIKSGKYKVTTGVFANGEIDKAAVTEDSFKLCQLETGKEYTALIRNNRCEAVLPLGDIKKPVLYKGRIFIADGNLISFDRVQRYSMGKWMDAGLGGRLLFGTPVGFTVPDINTLHIDKEVYIYADAYEDTVKIYGMRW